MELEERKYSKRELEALEELYDTTPEMDGSDLPPLNEGLTDKEIEEAIFFNQIKRGLVVLTGEPGAGKDTFMHYILWKLKLLFKDFRVLLDRKPRMLFGKYTPFDEEVLLREFRSLNARYKTGKSDLIHDFAKFSQHKETINEIINKWNAGNQELFYNAGIGLQEFWYYFYNREPHNPMNKAISPLFKRYRHYDLVVFGTAPHLEELDVKSCQQYITHELRCQQTSVKGVHAAVLLKTRFFNGSCVVETTDDHAPVLVLDALKPRERLGGKCYYNLFNSWERSEHISRVIFKE